jgi:hypothetical protein
MRPPRRTRSRASTRRTSSTRAGSPTSTPRIAQDYGKSSREALAARPEPPLRDGPRLPGDGLTLGAASTTFSCRGGGESIAAAGWPRHGTTARRSRNGPRIGGSDHGHDRHGSAAGQQRPAASAGLQLCRGLSTRVALLGHRVPPWEPAGSWSAGPSTAGAERVRRRVNAQWSEVGSDLEAPSWGPFSYSGSRRHAPVP